jgi:putative tryptophan/tyrosine transport system substrate-binding protein
MVVALRYAAKLPAGGDLMQLDQLKRREFITLVSGAAAWPLAARAQQPERMLRIGVISTFTEDDPEARNRLGSFQRGLQELGWIDGRNVRIDYRFTAGEPQRMHQYISEFVASPPDVILANSSPVAVALRQATGTIPIVFGNVIDPVAGGIVESLSRPGGNITGFTDFEYAMGGKWLELLKEAVPSLARATVLWSPNVNYAGVLRSVEEAAPRLAIRGSLTITDAAQIERDISLLAQEPGASLVVLATPATAAHRSVIIATAARHSLPTVFPSRYFVVSGGLLSYGPNLPDLYLRAAGYVDRILKGSNPADLPVQNPTRFELVINLKTAKTIGLTVPPLLLARADEVIE